MAARQYTDGDAGASALRWAAIGLGIAGAALAFRQLGGGRRAAREDASSAVTKAFTINRSPDEVAQLWNELDPLACASPAPPSAVPTSTCTTASSRRCAAATCSGTSSWARSSKSASR